ncbi:hypothetical protein KIPE111705_03440 [Kibdelosporangium persicum]|uniref:DUF5709 domain-containing protein n=1 Tax=Kibdelosporangium persicum TaxID=2698649 RepID=A0ABX2F7Q3_9PSEU|nr:hypothetical protein [Kibdelosporangium persicum]NRN67388.1 hypothetical protein [Kibdelosporangium persicum]
MPEFGAEAPIEDVVEQRIPVGDDRPDVSGGPDSPVPAEASEADVAEQAMDAGDRPGHGPLGMSDAGWEASEADVVDQQIEVPDEDFDR